MVNKKNIDLVELLQRVNNSDISSIKDIILRLISVINDPKSSVKDLQRIIEKDPPLSARLLKIANSAYYGYQRKIKMIQEAIVGIGFDAVTELALSQKVCELFEKENSFDGYSRAALWENSVAVALCNKYIYMREFRDLGENAYVAGLLHNIGIIIEDQFLHGKFKSALTHAEKNKCNLPDAETHILGFDHADVGRAVVNSWSFPDELVIAIGNHHKSHKCDGKFNKITVTSIISDYICQKNELGYCDAHNGDKAIFLKCLKKLRIKEKALDFIIEDVQKEIMKMKEGGWFQ